MALFQRAKSASTMRNTEPVYTSSTGYIDELVEHYKTRLLTEVNLEQITSLEYSGETDQD